MSEGMLYDCVQSGMTYQEAKTFLNSKEGSKQQEYIAFGQEKYSRIWIPEIMMSANGVNWKM